MSARWVNSVLAVLVLLAGGATIWAFILDEPGEGTEAAVNTEDGSYIVGSLPDDDEHDAVVAAVETAELALGWDYRRLGQGLGEATARMTGDFATEFGDTFDTITRPRAKQNKSITNALVRGAGVVHEVDGRVRCLLFIDQVVVSNESIAQDPDAPYKIIRSRVYMELEEVDGEWLVDAIGTVGSG
jgi:hypothetical protein